MEPVEVIRRAARFHLGFRVANCACVRNLKFLPVGHRPRIGAAPCVHHLAGLALGHGQTVDTAHGREGTDAASEAAGQLLHLADLALVLGDVLDAAPEGGGRVDLVDVGTFTKKC